MPFASVVEVAVAMRGFLGEGRAELPLPGDGRTLERWRALAAIGALDLSLAKIFEGHTDAVAIAAELDGEKPVGLSAVWAAESPPARLTFAEGRLSGRKSWCSGAAVVDSAVVSCWSPAGEPLLAVVELRQPGISISLESWQAVGMAASGSGTVSFEGVSATALGGPHDYVARPGFWHGGAGIAALWYGGAQAIAEKLASSPKIEADPHLAAHLGAVDVALRGARALLLEAAQWIDAHPTADASTIALRVRAGVESAAQEVLLRTGRALGPGPLCGDAAHAQRCADLPVFLRQSHAEHDLAALGRGVAVDGAAWSL